MASPSPVRSSDVETITKLREDWLVALNTDDIEGILSSAPDDILVYPPHEPPVAGIAGSRAWHEARIAQFKTRLTITPEELVTAGDMAFERFSFTIGLTPRSGGATIEDSGICFWLWRRQSDNSWKLARAIWNSENPVEPAMAIRATITP